MDKQIAMAPDTQQSKGLSSSDNQIKGIQGGKSTTSNQKEGYPDLFLPLLWKITGLVIIFVDIWTVCPLILIPWFW